MKAITRVSSACLKSFATGVSVALTFFAAVPARADQWTVLLTPASASTQNYNGALSIFVTTTQPVSNPANCPSADGYITTDPVIAKETLAIALTAIAGGHQIQVYVSSSQCAQNRPMILDFQVVP